MGKARSGDVPGQAMLLIPAHLPLSQGPTTAPYSIQIFENTLEKTLLGVAGWLGWAFDS